MCCSLSIQAPVYAQSHTAVMGSLLQHYNAGPACNTLPLLDNLLKNKYQNIVFLFLGGVGLHLLQKYLPASAFLHQHMAGELSAVFPSSSLAAYHTIRTGLCPITHGYLGEDQYIAETDDIVNLPSNTLSYNRYVPAFGSQPDSIPQAVSVSSHLEEASGGELSCVSITPFDNDAALNLRQFSKKIISACKGEDPKVVFAHWEEADSLLGIHSPHHIQSRMRFLNTQIQKLCSQLKNSLVVLTADRGSIEYEFAFPVHNKELSACLKMPFSIEPRASACFVKEGMAPRFEQLFAEEFGDDFLLLPRKEVLEKDWLGTGKRHPRLDSFLGDYLAIATGKKSLFWAPRIQNLHARAASGSLTPQEMQLPLVVIEC